MTTKGDLISVTHYINPQLFFFHIVDVRSDTHFRIKELEHYLTLRFQPPTVHLAETIELKPGVLVAAWFLPWDKYIRCRVLKDDGDLKYIVWAMDHGFPFISMSQCIRKLPKEERFRCKIEHIHRGGLSNILPSNKEYDFTQNKFVNTPKTMWCDFSCSLVKRYIDNAQVISFEKHFEDESKQFWGDLVVVDRRQIEHNVVNSLVDLSVAEENMTNFKEICSSFKCTKIWPYMNNNGTLNVRENLYVERKFSARADKENMTDSVNESTQKVQDWQERNQRLLQCDTNMADTDKPLVEANRTNFNVENVLTRSQKMLPPQDSQLSEDALIALDGNREFYSGPCNIYDSTKNSESFQTDTSLISTSSSVRSKRIQKLMEFRRKMDVIEKTANVNKSTEEEAVDNKKTHLKPMDAIDKTEDDSSCSPRNIRGNHVDYDYTAAESVDAASISSKSSRRDKRVQKLIEYRQKLDFMEKASNVNKTDEEELENNVPINSFKMHLTSMDVIDKAQKVSSGSPRNIMGNNVHSSDNKNGHDDLVETASNASKGSVLSKRMQELVKHKKKMEIIETVCLPEKKIPMKDCVPLKTNSEQNTEKVYDDFTLKSFFTKYINATTEPNEREESNSDLTDLCSRRRIERLKASQNYFTVEETPKPINSNKLRDSLNQRQCKTVPAGFNLANLVDIKNKREPNNELHQACGEILTATDENGSEANFRHTRSHTDKYKKLLDNEKHLLDVTNSDLSNTILEPMKISGSDTSKMNLAVVPKRKQLTAPSLQIEKISKILQKAENEKNSGNSSILDLKTIINDTKESGGDLKAKKDNSLNRSTTNSSISDTDNSRRKTSNKQALVMKRLELNGNSGKDTPAIVKSPALSQLEFKNVIFKSNKFNLGNVDVVAPQGKDLESKILAHGGKAVKINVTEEFSNVHFPQQEITEQMNFMRITNVYRIQSYGWNHILRGNSLFVVNPPRSGKTWCYLPAICSLVSWRIQSRHVPDTFGPVAIILVPSSTHVEHVSRHCQRLMTNCGVKVVSLFGLRSAIDVQAQLLAGCGILVTTPARLLRLLNQEVKYINGARLLHLVMDDIEFMLSRSAKDLHAAVEAILILSNKLKDNTLQMVATSHEWKPFLLSLIKKSNQPLLLIGDYLEAAAYSKAAISIKFTTCDKMSYVLQFIKKHPCEENRLMIFCNNVKESGEVEKGLNSVQIDCVACHSDTGDSGLKLVKNLKDWPRGLVIVCVDDIFPEINVQNANNIIHYSLPETWTLFTKRFAAMAQCYENLINENVNNQNCAQKVTSLVLLDEHSGEQLPRLHDFLLSHNQVQKINPEISKVVENVKMQRELKRAGNNIGLCPFVLEFGVCDLVRCSYRHSLTHFDIKKLDSIPQSGDLRVHILKVFSPTHYSARLLKHKPENSTTWVDICDSQMASLFAMQLNTHYSQTNSCVNLWPLQSNDICVCKIEDIYQRARILEVEDVTNYNIVQVINVKVELIDMGEIKFLYSNELYVCEDKFMHLPPQAINIRLLGVVPYDNERTWDSVATKNVNSWIRTAITTDLCVQIKINFIFAQTIWSKSVCVLEFLPTQKQYVCHADVRRSLILKNFGVSVSNDKVHVRDAAVKLGLLKEGSTSSDIAVTTPVSDAEYETYNMVKTADLNITRTSSNSNFSLRSVDAAKVTHKKEINKNTSKCEQNMESDNEDWDRLLDKPNDNELYIPLKKHLPEANVTTQNDGKDQWVKIPLQKLVKVEIGDENENGNWSNIFLQCIDDVSENAFYKLEELIHQHIKDLNDKATQNYLNEDAPSIMQNCLVKYQKIYLRAKVVDVLVSCESEPMYRFFLCDYGLFVKITKAMLFEDFYYPTTKEIVEFTPYQAIHCRLAGIKLGNLHNQQKVEKPYLFAYAVQENTDKNTDLDINSYKILLYECDEARYKVDAQMLNKLLVSGGCIEPDPETKHYLDLNVNGNCDSFNENNVETSQLPSVVDADKVVSFETLWEAFQNEDNDYLSCLKTEELHAKLKENTKTEHSQKDSNQKNENSLERVLNNAMKEKRPPPSPPNIVSCEENLPQLRTLHKRPQTTWYQTDYIIILVIHAPDVRPNDYYLEITPSTIHFVAQINGDDHVLALNLLGTIDPSVVSHEVRGLNIVIRLIKSIYLNWPQLLQEATKYSWLKYDLNLIETIDDDFILPQNALLRQINNNNQTQYFSPSENDSTDEDVYFDNYEPIAKIDDTCDLTTDMC